MTDLLLAGLRRNGAMRRAIIGVLLLVMTLAANAQVMAPGVVAASKEAVPTSTLYNGLVYYAKFDEASGNLIDHANGNNGTVTGCTRQQTGKIGYSYYFDGSDYINILQPSVLNFTGGTNAYTISFWVSAASSASGYIFGKTDGSLTTRQFGFYLASNKVYAYIGGASVTGSNASATTGSFVHVLITVPTSGNATYYINGSADAATTAVGSATNAYDILIGARRSSANTGATGFFTGYLDELKVWNRVLTSSERAEDYGSGNGKEL